MGGAFSELARAYEGIEADFGNHADLLAYRRSMDARTAPQVAFLDALRPVSGGPALEVGCGNGRLLLALVRGGVAPGGHGLDLARSRIDFARRWAADEGIEGVTFEAGDALAADLGASRFGLALCITGALAYFDPVRAGSAAELLARLRDALAAGGRLVLEVYPHPEVRRLVDAAGGGDVRVWHELDPQDPWRFYLSRYELAGDVVTHEKTFVHRESGAIDEGRSERLVLYRPESLRALVTGAGFGDVKLHEGWSSVPYAGGDVLVLTARKC